MATPNSPEPAKSQRRLRTSHLSSGRPRASSLPSPIIKAASARLMAPRPTAVSAGPMLRLNSPRATAPHSPRQLRRHPPRQIRPPRRNLPRAAIQQPAQQHRLARRVVRRPAQHIKHDIPKLTRSHDQPHPLRQKLHNMSSATTTRAVPARATSSRRSATWRSTRAGRSPGTRSRRSPSCFAATAPTTASTRRSES
jgi:hypothetical protein